MNLERGIQVTMLYNEKIVGVKKKEVLDKTFKGRVRKGRKQKLAPYLPRIRSWIQQHSSVGLSDLEEADFDKEVKIEVYRGMNCVLNDINNLDKRIDMIVRASDKWKHSEHNKKYDFVVIKNNVDNFVEGLQGVKLGRLLLFTQATWGNEYSQKLAVVKMMQRVKVDEDEIFPVFKYTDEIQTIDVNRIHRSAHMVPRWSTENEGKNTTENDLLSKYGEMIWNTHSDAACWNYYYDSQE